jgi:hypothetical protein
LVMRTLVTYYTEQQIDLEEVIYPKHFAVNLLMVSVSRLAKNNSNQTIQKLWSKNQDS